MWNPGERDSLDGILLEDVHHDPSVVHLATHDGGPPSFSSGDPLISIEVVSLGFSMDN